MSVGTPFYKTASYEIVDVSLLQAVARTGKPAIISTGNSSLADVESALKILADAGNDELAVLHCVSQYPAKYEDLNLNCLVTLAKAFGRVVGFSDHTIDNSAAIAAVALGASILEKHFTLSRNQSGPDHSTSLEPAELARYVQDVRDTEIALGDGIKRVMESEMENHRLARRSIHARIAIKQGCLIEAGMLCIKRPGLGIDPREIDHVIGRPARKHIDEDAWITWDMI
jgi:sialic acid synthase SpsE